jgi:hypothetical protein
MPKYSTDSPSMLPKRGPLYGDAWLKTNHIVDSVFGWSSMPRLGMYAFAWIMILNKLVRAWMTPEHRDSWIDIMGYAKLVVQDMDARTPSVSKPRDPVGSGT